MGRDSMHDIKKLCRFADIGSLGPTGTFHNVKFNFLTLVQRLEAFIIDSGKMYEYIVPILAGNEAITFFSAEPFNFTDH